jgi:phage terminase large subunit-like protein
VPFSSKRFRFDGEEADRAVFFVEEYCRHVQGPLAGQTFCLLPWQKQIVRDLFGWKRPDGTRRYRFLWLEVPRKSGKTSLAAALGLYMLLVDPEPGAEIVVAAGGAQHAAFCFNTARRMIDQDEDLSAVCKVRRRSIFYKESYFQFLSSKSETKFGANISCLIFDDIQVQRSRELHDVLITSMAARAQPLTLYLATAGSDRCSIGWELHEYAMKIRDGVVNDPSWLVNISAADASDDWTDPAVWRKAHPGLGTTVPHAHFEEECLRATQTPGFIDSFRRLYLNVWTEGCSPWLDMRTWDACGDAAVMRETLRGRTCRAGLDLSSTTDLTALVLLFPDADGGITVLPFAFCPSEKIRERSRRDRVDYVSWRDQGLLIPTPGNVVDQAEIRRRILQLSRIYRIEELAFDRWNSSMLISQLQDDGLNCTPVPQAAGVMNAPARELERLLAKGLVRHGGHPVLRWCAANTIVEMNDAGEIKPTKRKSIGRIDLIVAMLMALQRFMIRPHYAPAPLRKAVGV